MWNVNPDRDKSSGGFQNADLNKTQFDRNYGPDFGVDYARFSDPPDLAKDLHLKTLIEEQLTKRDPHGEITVMVRNGFIILKGNVSDQIKRDDIVEFVRSIPGVLEVINQITFLN